MKGKSLVLLALAILSGLAAMYGTSRMLTKNRSKAPSDMVDVLVAVRHLKVEEVLTPELVKVVPMSRATLPPGTFTSFKDVEDRWVRIEMLQDDPILDHKLAPKGSPAGLVSKIPQGERAYTIEVNEQTGVSGLILPDHRVDVVQVNPSGSNPGTADTILEDVQVLASNQVFTRPEDRSIPARTVTLAVTPEQVDKLVAARARGSLTLSLRGLNDHALAKPKPKPKPAEPILDRKLAPEKGPADPGPQQIRKEMRAYAIEVNEQPDVAWFVLPDHHVDVVQVNPSGNDPGTAETILEDVRVLASGQALTRPKDPSIKAKTVTLEVKPEQVDTLAAAQARGGLSLALRRLDDHTLARHKPTPPQIIYAYIYRQGQRRQDIPISEAAIEEQEELQRRLLAIEEVRAKADMDKRHLIQKGIEATEKVAP